MTPSPETVSPGATPIRIRMPGDLIELIPYLLGFHPKASLVLVGLHARAVAMTARLDLADLAALGPHPRAEWLTETLRLLASSGADDLVAAVYLAEGAAGPDAHPTAGVPKLPELPELPELPLVYELGRCAAELGIDLVDALLAHSGRWWSYLCDDPDCCPPGGTPLLGAASSTAARATFAGLVALPDRSDLDRMLAPEPDAFRLLPLLDEAAQRAAVALVGETRRRWRRAEVRALFAAARAAHGRTDPEGTGRDGTARGEDERLVRYAVALNDINVRDSVWRAMDTGRLGGRELWQRLATAVPAPFNAAPLFLFGWSAWRDGQGPLARIAATRALDSDPEYSAAEILLSVLHTGLDPFRTPRLRSRRPA